MYELTPDEESDTVAAVLTFELNALSIFSLKSDESSPIFIFYPADIYARLTDKYYLTDRGPSLAETTATVATPTLANLLNSAIIIIIKIL